jgi:hypothetical protein
MKRRLQAPISRPRVLAPLLAATACFWLVTAASAEPPDWEAVADTETVEALTTDEDGDLRETTIWLIVVDGQGYIRTSHSTRWGKNVVRNPDIALRIGDSEYPVRASFVEDEALRERVVEALRQKYGWIDGFLRVFRGSSPHIIRLDARAEEG